MEVRIIEGDAVVVLVCKHGCKKKTEHALIMRDNDFNNAIVVMCCDCDHAWVTYEIPLEVMERADSMVKAWFKENPPKPKPKLAEIFESEDFYICPVCNNKESSARTYTPICLECWSGKKKKKVTMIRIKIDID